MKKIALMGYFQTEVLGNVKVEVGCFGTEVIVGFLGVVSEQKDKIGNLLFDDAEESSDYIQRRSFVQTKDFELVLLESFRVEPSEKILMIFSGFKSQKMIIKIIEKQKNHFHPCLKIEEDPTTMLKKKKREKEKERRM
jgi:hypothetical protein